MTFRNIPPNGFPAIPDIEDLEGVEKDVSTLKTTTAGLAEDVSDLEEQKANQITIALAFNPESTYEVGDIVYYNGLSYRCTNEHTGEWDADDFAGTTIANELSELKSGLTNLWESTNLLPWGNYGDEPPVEYTTANNYSINRLIRIKAGTNGRYVYYFTPTSFSTEQVFEAAPDGSNYITLQFTAQNKIIIYAKNIKVREVVMFNNVSL